LGARHYELPVPILFGPMCVSGLETDDDDGNTGLERMRKFEHEAVGDDSALLCVNVEISFTIVREANEKRLYMRVQRLEGKLTTLDTGV
jgi:hypothetical protein